MEPEKQFKCNDCDAKFPTSDLLHTHQRRHGMSLNLPLKASTSASLSTPSILSKGSLSAGILSFVDETPTPTRFIRNCEEVGLFQDLQNVNPFDEDFRKAASSSTTTPTGEGNAFDFSFSSVLTGSGGLNTPTYLKNVASRSKRRYSDQDSLNTPQVFPYVSGYHHQSLSTNTVSTSTSLTPTPQSSVISQENLKSILQLETPTTPTTTYNHEEHVSIINYTSAISRQTSRSDKSETPSPVPISGSMKRVSSIIKSLEKVKPSEDVLKSPTSSTPSTPSTPTTHTGSRISLLKIRSKANLKLDLKTVISRKSGSVAEKFAKISKTPSSSEVDGEVPQKGRETLDRKKAAAHRSRERRKQWIYGLESRCRALEGLLAQSQAEVTQLKAENNRLRSQLDNRLENVSDSSKANLAVSESIDHANQSTLINQSCQTERTAQFVEDQKASSASGEIVPPISLPTVKAKRGRPKKGQERRVPIISVPIISSGEAKVLPKIPILPLPNRQLKRS